MVGAPIGEAAGIYEELGLNVKLTGNGKVQRLWQQDRWMLLVIGVDC